MYGEWGLKHSLGLQLVIQEKIDTNFNGMVECPELNVFFEEIWINAEEIEALKKMAEARNKIVSQQGSTDMATIKKRMGPKSVLKLTVIEDAAAPNP